MSAAASDAAVLAAMHATAAGAHAGQAARNKRPAIGHFDDFVNKRDLGAINRNMAPGFLDHDGPGGRPTDRDGGRAMMAGMRAAHPDLRVEVQSAVAEGGRVVVLNVWTGTEAGTGEPSRPRGFVQRRVVDGKIAERWATVMPIPDHHRGPMPAAGE